MLPAGSQDYFASRGRITDLITELFDQKLDNGFTLESLGGMLALSRVVANNNSLIVGDEVKGGIVEKKAVLYSSSTDPEDEGFLRRVEIEIDENNRAETVDVVELEREALVALEQAIAELAAPQG